jgi:hypothetical protein
LTFRFASLTPLLVTFAPQLGIKFHHASTIVHKRLAFASCTAGVLYWISFLKRNNTASRHHPRLRRSRSPGSLSNPAQQLLHVVLLLLLLLSRRLATLLCKLSLGQVHDFFFALLSNSHRRLTFCDLLLSHLHLHLACSRFTL